MKRTWKWTALITGMAVVLAMAAGCSSQDGGGSGDGDTYVLRVNTNMGENDKNNSAFGQALTSLAEECARESGGRLEVDIYLNSQLGSTASEVIGGAQFGSFEMFNHVAASWGEYTNAFLPVNIPYLFTDEEVLKEFLYGPQGDKIKEKVLADTDARIIYYGYLGFRHIVNDVRPITSPDDLKGMKMRVLSDPYTIKAFEAYGCSTIQVSYSELYTASQQGLIDGSDGPFTNIYNSKLNEVQKYLSETRNAYTLGVMCISQRAYENLPDDLREIFDTACENAQKIAEQNDGFEQEALDYLKGEMEFNQLSDGQLQQFVAASQPVYDMAREELGEDYWNEIIQEIADIEARLGK